MDPVPGSPSAAPADPRIVKLLEPLALACLIVTGAVAAAALLAWVLPAAAEALPAWWKVMRPATAVALLLCVAALLAGRGRLRRRRQAIQRALAVVVAACGLLILATPAVGIVVAGEDLSLTAGGGGRIAEQTAVCLFLLGATIALLGARRHSLVALGDALTLALFVTVLVVAAGYWFDAPRLVGQAPYVRTAPHTLLCIALLGTAVVTRRTDRGLFSILVGTGIGSRMARTALPLGLLVPLLVTAAVVLATTHEWIQTSYAAALIAVSTATAVIGLLLLQAWRSNALERELRSLSLTDELTGLYNRRAFLLLGEHATLEARREGEPLTVLYFDLDGLKAVNDALGHDAGSQLIREFADLLRGTVRANDIAARLGGDEFAVVAVGDEAHGNGVLARLEQQAAVRTAGGGDLPAMRFSAGCATGRPAGRDAFEELVRRADSAMYAHKKARRPQALRDARTAESPRVTPLRRAAAGGTRDKRRAV